MKRTISIFLALAMLFSVVLSCGAWASEESTTIEWSTHHYLDADGNVKGDTVIVNHPNVAGFCTLSEDEMYAAYLRVRIDGEHADLCISVDNETFYVWTEDPVFTVNVYASSALSASFTGTITEGSSLISLDADARDFIVQDMRMLSGETVIEMPTSDGFGFIFVLPHDGISATCTTWKTPASGMRIPLPRAATGARQRL